MIEIIAEIAQGYEGSPKLTELLTKGALESDADYIKFQLVYADELATPDYEYYELFKSLEMEINIWEETVTMIQTAKKQVLFDVYGLKSLNIAKNLNADGVKLSTTEFYNSLLLKETLKSFGKIYISIGGIPVDDIDSLIEHILKGDLDKICFMYGFQAEPTPLAQNNLNKLKSLKKRYPGVKLGFMDHSSGEEEDALFLSLIALGMEIDCIEKHITLDRALKIEDFVSALEPSRFKEFVRIIRKFENALGSDNLQLTKLEEKYRRKATKVVVANHDLRAGYILKLEDVCLKRVGNLNFGTPIYQINDVIGKSIKKNIKCNALIPKEAI